MGQNVPVPLFSDFEICKAGGKDDLFLYPAIIVVAVQGHLADEQFGLKHRMPKTKKSLSALSILCSTKKQLMAVTRRRFDQKTAKKKGKRPIANSRWLGVFDFGIWKGM